MNFNVCNIFELEINDLDKLDTPVNNDFYFVVFSR